MDPHSGKDDPSLSEAGDPHQSRRLPPGSYTIEGDNFRIFRLKSGQIVLIVEKDESLDRRAT